jgi:hypothetical protein
MKQSSHILVEIGGRSLGSNRLVAESAVVDIVTEFELLVKSKGLLGLGVENRSG